MSAQASQVLEAIPFRQLIGGIAIDLCQAQHDIDLMSIRLTETMSSTLVDFDGERVSLLDLGLTPTFLQMVDTVVEVKVSISLSRDDSSDRIELAASAGLGAGGGGLVAGVTAVDARFSSRFQYSVEGSSAVSTRLVPVPAPAELMNVVQRLADEQRSTPQ